MYTHVYAHVHTTLEPQDAKVVCYGLYSHGLYSCGICIYGLYSNGLYSSDEREQEDDDFGVLAVLCVLLFGPDTGTLLMLCPQAMSPRSPHVRALSAGCC